MKNKLLTSLLYLIYQTHQNQRIYVKATDEAGKKVYEKLLTEYTAYWFAIYSTYGYKKTEKIIADYTAMRDAQNI